MSLVRFVLLVIWSLATTPAQAALISLVPNNTVVVSGESFNVDVQITELLPDEVVYLFELDLLFNPAFFSLTGSNFGVGLGQGVDSVQQQDELHFYEFSFLWDDELKLLQGSGFTLLTLTFNAVAPTTVAEISLAIRPLGLLDFNEKNINVEAINAAAISIAPRSQPVSTPPGAALLLLTLCTIFSRRRRTRYDG